LDGSDRVLDGRDKWSAHVAVMRFLLLTRAQIAGTTPLSDRSATVMKLQ